MVTLLILDGYGVSDKIEGNAIALAKTPNLDSFHKYPYTTLKASGEAVGLTPGQMGNSEVGHMNLGAGRVIYQDLPRINNDIKSGKINNNTALVEALNHALKNNSSLHIMGLVSDGGVHSHIDHLKAIIDMAHKFGLKKVYVHAFLDGRDTLKDCAGTYILDLENHMKGKAKLASIVGRVYAMDRENRWDRIKRVYDMMVAGNAAIAGDNIIEHLRESYNNEIFDEYIEPAITKDFEKIQSGDSVIYFNFRTDRERELTEAFTQDTFVGFERQKLQDLCFCTMTEYSSDFEGVLVAYPPEKIENNLSAIISQSGMKQFHVSETTKYAHVTFFFNGGIEEPYLNEDRKLIDSYNVKNFSEFPQMKAPEITDEAVRAIESGKYDFVLINISNPDMLGHTGDIEATIESIEMVDKCSKRIVDACLRVQGECIITADHGNAEKMIDDDGNVVTTHTTNDVPLWLVSQKHREITLKSGKLSNVAPTVLKLLGVKIPEFMDEPLF